MKKALIILVVFLLLIHFNGMAQCAMCTKTAQQLGEKPALGLNRGIIYLMLSPFLIVGFISYKWWKGRDKEY